MPTPINYATDTIRRLDARRGQYSVSDICAWLLVVLAYAALCYAAADHVGVDGVVGVALGWVLAALSRPLLARAARPAWLGNQRRPSCQ